MSKMMYDLVLSKAGMRGLVLTPTCWLWDRVLLLLTVLVVS